MQGSVNKSQRYRAKRKAEGRCPHCGEPCAPYYECEERRAYKNARGRARRLGIGPIVSAAGQWIATNSNQLVPAYTSNADDARRLPRKRGERYKPTHSIPFDEMTEDQLFLEIAGLIYYCPMTEDEIDRILRMKQFIFWRQKVLADPTRSSEERCLSRRIIREELPPCIAMLHERGLYVGQIVAMLRAPWALVRYYWMRCEAARQAPTRDGMIR